MRAWLWTWVACVGLAWPTAARAEPRTAAKTKYQAAVRLVNSGNAEQALVLIEQGLAAAPQDLQLLGLKGSVLLALRDYPGALDVYEAYLGSGATGANQRRAQQIVKSLIAVRTTFVDITLSNGPAAIYLDSRSQDAFCTAEPACNKPILPGDYKVIAQRPGFEIWTGRLVVQPDTTATLAITLVEKPSRLTMRAPPGAQVTVDGQPFAAPADIAAGTHHVVVTLASHRSARLDAEAHGGVPVALDVVLTPLTPIRVEPPGTALVLDGKPIAIEAGGIAIPPGDHALVATAKGYVDRTTRIEAERAPGEQIVIRLERTPPPPPAAPAPSSLTLRRKIALAAGGVGVVTAAGGLVLGIQSRHFEDEAYGLCASPSIQCDRGAEANRAYGLARSRALEADLGFGVAGAAAVTAAVLWLAGAPESRASIVPRLGPASGLDLAIVF